MEDDDEALAVGAIYLARRSAWSAIVGATADDMPPADPCAQRKCAVRSTSARKKTLIRAGRA